MSNRHRRGIDIVDVLSTAHETAHETDVAVLDPPESGPPEADELGNDVIVLPIEDDHSRMPEPADPSESATAAALPIPFVRGNDMAGLVANLVGQADPVWPSPPPLSIDWPWPGNPEPGEIIGWNWETLQVVRVVSVPGPLERWPYTMGVEIQPMPEEWLDVQVIDLVKGRIVEVIWYTAWNRAYEQYVSGENGILLADEAGRPERRTDGGWLGVQQVSA